MEFLKDDTGQGAAEMILLFGGVIVITVVALAFYSDYVNNLGENINGTEVEDLKTNISNLQYKFIPKDG